MSYNKQKLLKIFSYILLSIILLLFVFIVFLKIYTPFLVKKSLKSISDSKQVILTVKKAEFSLKNGIKIKNLKLSDKEKESLRIGELSIKPNYLSSLKERKIVLEDVDIKSPNLDASGESISTIIKLFEGGDDKKEDSNILYIKNINIDDLVVQITEGLKINLDNFDIDWKKTETSNLDFDISALISINENESSGLSGKISVHQKEKIAKVELNFVEIRKQINSDYLKIPSDSSANLTANVNYTEEIESNGEGEFVSDQRKDIGEFSYDLLYESSGTLNLKSSSFSLNDFITLSANGTVKNLKGSKDFDITSELTIADLNEISEWTNLIEANELKGNLKSNAISLTGSKERNNLIFIANGKIKNGVIVASNHSAENFEIDFDFNRNFLENVNLLTLKFDAKKLRLDLPGDSNTSLERLYTKEKLNLKIYKEPDGNLKIEGDKFKFEKIRHDYFITNKGAVENVSLTLKEGSSFVLKGTLNGNGFNAKGFKVSDINIDFNTEKNDEGAVTTGKLKLLNGSFKTFLLDKYEGSFSQSGVIVKLNGSSLTGNHPNRATAELVVIKIPEEGSSDIKIDFENATLFELLDKIKSKINNASIVVNSQTADIKGKVKAQNLSFGDQVLKKPSFDLELISSKLNLRKIRGNILNGDLSGNIFLDLNSNPYDFSTNLSLLDPVIKNDELVYPAKSLDAEFKGNLYTKLINAKGSIRLNELKISKGIYETKLTSGLQLNIKDETINIENGFINSVDSKKVNFTGEINNFSSDKRKVEVNFEETELNTFKNILYPFLPFEIQEGDLSGTVKPRIGVKGSGENYEWLGKIKINNASLDTLISLTELSVKGINGVFTLDNKSFSKNPFSDVLGKDFNIDKKIYKKYLSRLNENKQQESNDYLKIDEINYSFLNIKNIETLFEMNSSKVNINYFKSEIYRGNIFGAGVINMDKQKYNFSLIFDDLSLNSISDSIPSIKDYITGRFNGMMWVNAGKSIEKTDGIFSIWATKSDKEKLSLGKPLLERIGATGRFFTGSSRRYDKGLISGYIKEGFMTFKELEITNSILGYKDLKIRVDEKKNSISLNQMFSVIREIAKRASQGGIKIDFEK